MPSLETKAGSKRKRPDNYFAPTHSHIATFSFVNGPTVFSPRRRTAPFRSHTIEHRIESPRKMSAQGNGTGSEDPGIMQDIKGAFFHASRAFKGLIGSRDDHRTHEMLLESGTGTECNARLDCSLKSKPLQTSSTPIKRPRSSPGVDARSSVLAKKKQSSKKTDDLTRKLDNCITPEKNGNLTFATKKDPFKWDSNETSFSPTPANHVPYGSSFYRRKRSRIQKPESSKSLTIRQPSEELSYLRMVFNGEYKAPALIEEQKNTQLKLREQERERLKSTFRNSVTSLTERFKAVLAENLGKKESPDDLILVKERRLPGNETPLKHRSGHQRLRFDTSVLTFEEEFKSYKRLVEERRRIQTEVREKRQKKPELVPKLTNADVMNVKKALSRTDNGVLMNKNNIEIKVYDFKTLAPKRWLNDIIVEFFMKHVEITTERCVAFNSYFYTTLSQRGYQGVRRWMKKKKVQVESLSKIFVPINLNQSHWALGFVDIDRKTISYIDSLSSGPSAMGHAILKLLQEYLVEESGAKIGRDFELIHEQCPQQPNGFDCGIYVCVNALYLSKDAPLSYEHKDINRMRPYIGHLILSGD
ncbi:LAQU0S26e00144g1_1 [Lachancea quebecensis]|uniref:LAQU0S26e00144g1_1 n=1 Tax=Lachancea quebecensis TaxID=1654605 RepID=A0A0P1KXQ0_9SACH|nr:LAQU0S26e00144g1_1 [Lachancea quebecensis]